MGQRVMRFDNAVIVEEGKAHKALCLDRLSLGGNLAMFGEARRQEDGRRVFDGTRETMVRVRWVKGQMKGAILTGEEVVAVIVHGLPRNEYQKSQRIRRRQLPKQIRDFQRRWHGKFHWNGWKIHFVKSRKHTNTRKP